MFEYEVSPRARSEVKSQNLPSEPACVRDETVGDLSAISHSEFLL